jgi:hypothetical protein
MKKEAHLDTVQSINSVSNQLASLKLDVDLCPSLPSSPDEALVTQLGVCFDLLVRTRKEAHPLLPSITSAISEV